MCVTSSPKQIILTNEFLLIHAHQDLLNMSHPLFHVNFISGINTIKFRFVFQNLLQGQEALKVLTYSNCSCTSFNNSCTSSYYSRLGILGLPADIIPNKLALNVPNNILRNPPFYSFASFSIVPLMPFLGKPDYSRDFIKCHVLFCLSTNL